MDEAAQNTLDKIQVAVAADHVEMTSHFEQQLGIRGMLWADLLTVIDLPSRMEEMPCTRPGKTAPLHAWHASNANQIRWPPGPGSTLRHTAFHIHACSFPLRWLF